jgi:multiple sugar transport system substrate-binding protein
MQHTARHLQQAMSRRQFLHTATVTTAGVAGVLTTPPAFAAKKRITMLSWNHFVPASDDELRRQAEEFSKSYGAPVQVETIAHLQLPAKWAAEVNAQSGHDIVIMSGAFPWLYEKHLLAVDDLVEALGKTQGGWYPFCEESFRVTGTWRSVPWFWISFPATYNETIFKQFGVPVPDTWADVLAAGTKLKKEGHPIGIAVSHCADANTTFWSINWCFGGVVLDKEGQVAIRSPQTEAAVEYYRELFDKAMEDEVLAWDDASNNRFILSGKGSWIHNPISPYNAALAKDMPIAKDINHHITPAGPAGRHNAPPIQALGIWKFARNPEGAKEFLKYLYQPDNFNKWIEASNAFNHGPLRAYENHPIWATNPKFAMLPKEGDFGHPRGWPYRPSPEVARVEELYILPDMVAKAIREKNTKAAMQWGEDQIVKIMKEAKDRPG